MAIISSEERVIEDIIHGRAEIRNFSSSVEKLTREEKSSFSLVIKTSQIHSIRVASSGETSIKRTRFSADD